MRTIVLAIALLGAAATPAKADIQLIDPASGAAATLVTDDYIRLLGRVGDGFVIENARNEDRLRLTTDGSTWPAPEFDRAGEIGPGGQAIWTLLDGFEVRAPDGHVVGAYRLPDSLFFDPQFAWSADGSRVVVLEDTVLLVLDTATGATLARRTLEGQLGPQALSPDGSALVYTHDDQALRLELATGRVTKLGRANAAAWSARGQIALSRDTSIAVLGSAGVRADPAYFTAVLWSPDGSAIAFGSEVGQGACSDSLVGVAVATPGGEPRTLVEASGRGIRGLAWAADGRLAVDREADFGDTAKRGKRHPWPKRVASQFYVHQRGGNSAIRRVLLRVARSLKAGAEREPVLARMRRDMAPIQDRYDEIDDTIVRDAIGDELDRWLDAAGFEPVEAADEFMC